MTTTQDRTEEATQRCPACGGKYVLPLDGDPTRQCPHCGIAAQLETTLGDEQLDAAREWLVDCGAPARGVREASASTVELLIERRYVGGVAQFVKDGAA
jgi:hypothetical protein